MRALAVTAALVRTSIAAQMQYRADFLINLVMAFFWVGWNVAPVVVLFELRESIAGFRLPEALLVLSAFLIEKAILDGMISPNLVAVVEKIRDGTLDFVLLKPVDSQLMVSVSKMLPAKLVDLSAGLAIAAWSIARLEPAPSAGAVIAGGLMLLAGAAVLYSLWLMLLATAFWFVRIDNLSFLFGAIFDAGRWPIQVFRGWVRFLLTWVLPIAVMTSFPALAVLGRLELEGGLLGLGVGFGFLLLSRLTWRLAVRRYASASS